MQQEVASIISNIKSSKSNKNDDAVTNSQSDEKLPKSDKVKNDNSIAAKKNNNSNNSNGNGYDKSEGSFKKREGGFNRSFRRSDNPDVLYGRDVEGQSITLREIEGEMGEVIVRGQVIDIEERPIRNERTILSIVISDFTDSIVIKLFMRDENLKEFMDKVKKGMFIKVKGITTVDKFDNDLIINSVSGIMKFNSFLNTCI